MRDSISDPSNKREKTHRKSTGGGASLPTPRMLALVCIGVGGIVIGALVVRRSNTSRHAPASPPESAAQETTPPSSPAAPHADYRKLVGRWVRTDTPYVIEIKEAGNDGTLKAGYYNPRSINVARAEAKDKNGKLDVFVELRDAGYPGSTYTLTYDRANDVLRGVYYQAAMGQSYAVAFARMRPER